MKIYSVLTPLMIGAFGLCHLQAQTFTNADFEAGNIGFSSDYQFANLNGAEGEYTVRSDPQNWNGEFVNFGDHTTGVGKMLVVNGATAGDPAVWRQTVSLDPNTSLRFQSWVGTAVAGGPANLVLKINAVQVGASYVLPDATGTWALWEQSWTSSAGAAYTFEIVNLNSSRKPNDFYLDDVSLVPGLIQLVAKDKAGDLELRWPADPAWGLFTSSSMAAGSWTVVTNVPTTDGKLKTLQLPMHGPQGFFRLQRLP
jgi:hypothetical protein